MSSAPQPYLAEEWRRELEPRPPVARPTVRPAPSTGSALDRRAVPMNSRELLPMAAIMLLIAGIAAMTVLYLAAFATGARQARTEESLDRKISQAESDRDFLAAEAARLQRRERIEREAARLRLLPVTPEASDRFEMPEELVSTIGPAPTTVGQRPRAAPAVPNDT